MNISNKKIYTVKAYEQFFLGLLEGDGSIQVNHWRKFSLQFRIIIKLKYTSANYAMCAKIRQQLGIMNLHIRRGFVIMVEDHRIRLLEIMAIIDKYGLLLTHQRRQYAFFKYCYNNRITYNEYAHIKNLKESWFGFNSINNYNSEFLLQLSHWPNWLAGFSEAESCFCIRSNGSHSFSIAQKDGIEVLTAIKNTFKIPNKIRSRSTSQIYFLETYRGEVLQNICDFYSSPNVVGLLGEKQLQYKAFRISLEKRLRLKVR